MTCLVVVASISRDLRSLAFRALNYGCNTDTKLVPLSSGSPVMTEFAVKSSDRIK